MKRRQVLASLIGAAAILPAGIRAAPADGPRRIGVLMPFEPDDREGEDRLDAFVKGLFGLGWTPQTNLRLDVRWAIGAAGRIQAAAAEIVDLRPDAILVSNVPHLRAVARATRTVPIVFAQVIDPVSQGFVQDLAHPGGNITGFTNFVASMPGKWLDLIRAVVPGLSRLLLIYHPDTTPAATFIRPVEEEAAEFGLGVASAGVRNADDIVRAFAGFDGQPGHSGLFVMPSFPTAHNRQHIVDLATRHRLPGVFPYRYFTTIGGLMSYGIDTAEPYRRAAAYVDRILKGASPADLPVQQPTKFVLTVNLRTARTLGITMPPPLLAVIDEAIER